MKRQALDFLREHRHDDQPFFLEIAPYAPHSRNRHEPAYPGEPKFPAELRDRAGHGRGHGNCGLVDCHDLTTADLPGFADPREDNRPDFFGGRSAPQWNRAPQSLSANSAERYLRDRARMAQSIDRMLMRILHSVPKDTYVILTSDNGFHLGQLGMMLGKGTAYDTDTHVPALVVGPGVVPGERDGIVSNIDWAPTFEDIAQIGSPAYRSGTSMVPTFGDPGARLQDYVFFEHTYSRTRPGTDPDRWFTRGGINAIPSYVAVRSNAALLVRSDLDRRWGHATHAYELYVYAHQGTAGRSYERVNQYDDPAYADIRHELMAKLRQWDACHDISGSDPVPDSCRNLTQQARLG